VAWGVWAVITRTSQRMIKASAVRRAGWVFGGGREAVVLPDRFAALPTGQEDLLGARRDVKRGVTSMYVSSAYMASGIRGFVDSGN